MQFGRRSALLANESHDEHITPEKHRLRAGHPGSYQTRQIPHLLFRPGLDHLPRVVLTVAVPVSEGGVDGGEGQRYGRGQG